MEQLVTDDVQHYCCVLKLLCCIENILVEKMAKAKNFMYRTVQWKVQIVCLLQFILQKLMHDVQDYPYKLCLYMTVIKQ